MLAHGDDDKCIEDAIRQIEHHVDCIVQDPSYEIPDINMEYMNMFQDYFKPDSILKCAQPPHSRAFQNDLTAMSFVRPSNVFVPTSLY